MSRESVTYRLGVSGDQEIRATLAAIGESGDASSRRMARAFERDMRVLEAGAERAKRRYEQLKAIGSTTQREIAMQTGLDRSVFGDTKSAEASMRAFVMEQDKLTRSRERLIAQADPLFAAQQRYNATMAEAMRLDRAGALAKGDLAKVQARAKAELESLSVTQQGFTRSSGAMTSGLQQAGFQVSDFAVQVGGGTSAIRAASQQAPQLVQAMALMGMGAENTNSKFGKFTAFLAGPWGAAITVGVSLIGVFASKMGESDDASEKLSGALDFQRMSTEELTKAIDDQVRSAEDAIAVGAAAEIQARRTAEANLKEAISEREKTRAKLDGMLATERRSAGQGSAPGTVQGAVGMQVAGLRAEIAAQDENIAKLKDVLQGKLFAVASSEADARLDPLAGVRRKYELDRAATQKTAREERWSQERTRRELEKLGRARDAETKRIQDQQREHEKLARGSGTFEFGSPIVGGKVGAPFGQKRGDRRHGGVDIPTAVGTPVVATADGVVSFAGERGDYGNLLTIRIDDRTETRDAHLSRFAVAVGDVVKKGQVIGYSGGARGAPGAGNSTGPHLHHELRIDGKAVNPFGKYAIDDRYADVAQQILAEEKRLADERETNVKTLRTLMEQGDPLLAIANKLKDELAEIDRLAGLSPGMGGIGSEQAEILRDQARQRARKGELETKVTAIGPQLDYATKFLDEADEKDADYVKRLGGAKADQAEAMAFLELEAKMLGASVREREAAIAQFEYIADLKRQGLDLSDEEVRKLIEGNAEWFRRRGLIDEANETLKRQRQLGEQIIDTLLDPSGWDDWGEMGKRVINMLIQEFLLLAAINPLKNAMFGTDYATLGKGGLLGFLGGIFGGGKAGGSEYTQAGFFEVGEFGKELVRLPRGSQVVNANRTRAMERSGAKPAPRPIVFDMRGAVVTEDLMRQMQAMADKAARDGAQGGFDMVVDGNQRSFGGLLAV